MDIGKERILYVLRVLWEETDENHPMSASQIVRRLEQYGIECERKIIYKDLAVLEDFGFDIIRNRTGTYMASRYLDLPELKLLVDIVQGSRFVTEKKTRQLTSKLLGFLSVYEREKLHHHLICDEKTKPANESIYYNIDAIHEAIGNNRQIAFLYGKWDANKHLVPKRQGEKYMVSPWFLLSEDSRYYLVAFEMASGRMKHFRVDKMMEIAVVDAERTGRDFYEALSIKDYAKEHFKMFQGEKHTVTLRCKDYLVGALLDRFGRMVWMHKVEPDEVELVVDVVVSDKFFGWVTGMHGDVRIVEPADVRLQYQRMLERILEGL